VISHFTHPPDESGGVSKYPTVTKTERITGEKAMSNQIENQEKPKFDISESSETQAEKRLKRASEEAAEKAERTEQQYDQGHSISTK
jgi:hypothetical protein